MGSDRIMARSTQPSEYPVTPERISSFKNVLMLHLLIFAETRSGCGPLRSEMVGIYGATTAVTPIEQ